MTNRKVLLVEDQEEPRYEFSAVIKSEGYEVVTAEDGEEALDIFSKANYLVVITDLLMPKLGGLKVLEKIKRLHPSTKVIIITAVGAKPDAIKALKLHAFDYIEKGSSKFLPELLKAIGRAFTEAETQIRIEREVLSFLTHTLRNTLSGGPQTVHQVLRLVNELFADRQGDQRVYRISSNIASLYSIFTSMDNMLDAYKVYVSDPVDVERRWQAETGGDVSLDSLLALVVKQTIGRVLFEEGNVGQMKRLISAKGAQPLKEVRNSFLQEILLAKDEAKDLADVVKWIKSYFPVIELKVHGHGIAFNANGIRFSLLFAILSEIIYNSLKYSDGSSPVQVTWEQRRSEFLFSCKNEFSELSTEKSGSQKGLVFINGLTRLIEGVEFAHKTDDNTFIVELSFQRFSLVKG